MENKVWNQSQMRIMPSSELSRPQKIRINLKIAKLKGANVIALPPSSPVLEQKIKRTHYVSFLWKRTDQQSPPITDLDPCQHGWERKCDNLTIRWFDGDQLPMDVCQAIDADTLKRSKWDQCQWRLNWTIILWWVWLWDWVWVVPGSSKMWRKRVDINREYIH